MHVPGAINARVSDNHLKVGGMNSRGTRWLDAATVGRVNAKLFIQARYQSEKQKKAVLDRAAKGTTSCLKSQAPRSGPK